MHNSVLVLWLWAKRQQQQQCSAACGVTLCPAVALLPTNSVIYYPGFALDELSNEKMLKMHFLYERLCQSPHLLWYCNNSRGHRRMDRGGTHSWEIRDLFLDLFPAFTCTRSKFVLQGCSCVSSPTVLRLTAVGALFANAIAAKHKVAN